MKGVLEEVKLEVCFQNEMLLVAMVVHEGLRRFLQMTNKRNMNFHQRVMELKFEQTKHLQSGNLEVQQVWDDCLTCDSLGGKNMEHLFDFPIVGDALPSHGVKPT